MVYLHRALIQENAFRAKRYWFSFRGGNKKLVVHFPSLNAGYTATAMFLLEGAFLYFSPFFFQAVYFIQRNSELPKYF